MLFSRPNHAFVSISGGRVPVKAGMVSRPGPRSPLDVRGRCITMGASLHGVSFHESLD